MPTISFASATTAIAHAIAVANGHPDPDDFSSRVLSALPTDLDLAVIGDPSATVTGEPLPSSNEQASAPAETPASATAEAEQQPAHEASETGEEAQAPAEQQEG